MAAQTYENHDELDQPVARDGLGVALIVVTTVCLLVAFILIERGMAERYNAGMFGDPAKNAPAPVAPK